VAKTEKKSRTQMKREMAALQKLGERLVGLTPDQLKKIDLEPELEEAVDLARTLTKHGAIKRQMQYIGALMRQVDANPIQSALERIDRGDSDDTLTHKQTEKWRDRLLSGDEALVERIVKRFPSIDKQRFDQLVESARNEKESGRPPKSARLLFRYLKPFAHYWAHDIQGDPKDQNH
jgi:ribosome-associated protein